MSAAPPYDRFKMTPEEYLAFDHASDTRYEYVDGYVVAQAGATGQHAYIVGGMMIALGIGLRGSGFIVAASDLRVAVASGNYRYPDIVVTCGSPEYEDRDDHIDILLNPTLLVEVMSESTARTDLTDKLLEYGQIDAVSDYLIVAQDRPQVLHYQRTDEGWALRTVVGLDASIALPNLEITLTLADIYAQVIFEADSSDTEG